MSLLIASVGVFAAPGAYAVTSPCTDGTTPTPSSDITCTSGTVLLGVTPGTSTLTVTAIGAGGAGGSTIGGGSGGSVSGTVTLPPNTAKLAVTAGAGGAAGDEFGLSGPLGGGGSAVVALNSSNTIIAKLVIAGGGGAGGGGDANPAGVGGNAGSAGGTAFTGIANGGSAGSGSAGGAAGAGNNDFGASQAGVSDNAGSYLPAIGGGGGQGIGQAVPSYGGGGGGGYGGGGGGGAGNTLPNGEGSSVAGGGGGGSSFASSTYAAGAAVTIASANGGAAGGAGSDGSVEITMGSATGPPSAPATISAVAGDSQATVTFSVPTSDGGATISGYTLTSSPSTTPKACTASPCTMTGLTNGTPYTFTVTATNTYGTSVASTASNSVTPARVPDAPTAVTAVAGNGQATVSFTAPVSNGGSAITGYTATSTPGNTTGTCVTSPCTVTGLTNGTSYTFKVFATNGIGNSLPSASSTAVIPVGPPAAPTITATPASHQITLSFTAPANGGSPITSYQVSLNAGNSWQTLTTTTAGSTVSGIVTGLTNGTTYQVQVRALNVPGNGAASNTAPATPASVPDPPTNVSAVAGNAQAVVSFTAPISNGGSAITGYTVTSTPGSVTKTCVTSPCTVTGLTNGTSYTFTVVATNAIGDSISSGTSTAVVPSTVPSAPLVTATGAGFTITVTFAAPYNGGAAITGYQFDLEDQDDWSGLTVTESNGTLTGHITVPFSSGSFEVSIRALNVRGSGTPSTVQQVSVGAVPNPPTAVTGSVGNAQSIVSFSPPADNGGHPITGYTVTSTPGSFVGTCTNSPCLVTGLTNGTSYTFTVIATSSYGDSLPSQASAAVIPATTPSAPIVTATPGDEQISVSFAAPDDGGSAITGYEISVDGGDTWTTLAVTPLNGTLTGVKTGLTNGTAYPLAVRALNSRGNGAPSETQSVTPAAVPDPPTGVSAVSGNAQAVVSFSAPLDNGGSAITAYTTTSAPGGLIGECATSPCTVLGLTNGTSYTFTVVATNAIGDSLPSQASTAVIPSTVPSAPVVTVTAGNQQIEVSFAAPDNGGSAITSYQMSLDNGDTWATLDVTTADGTVTGVQTDLLNGTTYQVSVRALNIRGNGAASVTQPATPATVPDPPTAVSAVAGNGQATVSFTAPTDNGGSTITTYTVTSSPDDKTVTCDASPCLVTDLTNGTPYTFTVVATNGVGDSTPSAASPAVTPITVPGMTTALAVVATTASSITVSFTPPGDGGSTITGYEISTDGGDTWQPLSVTGDIPVTGTVSGLTASTTYPLKVRATNLAGTGDASGSFAGTTRPATLAAPTATPGIASVTVTWVAASDPTVTGYTVTAEPGPATCETTSIDTSCVIGATAGVSYLYTVVAHSPNGDSDVSAATQPVVATAPKVPQTAPLNAAKTLTTTDGVLTTVQPGQDITVIGTGFAPYSSVTIILYSSPVVLATPVTNAQGSFSQPVTIPASIAPGIHNLVASGVDTNGDVRMIRMQVSVDPAVVAPISVVVPNGDTPGGTTSNGTAPNDGGALPFTGAPIDSLVLWGAIAAAFGVGLVRASRRRKRL